VIEIDSVIDHNTNHDHDDAFGYFEDAQDMNEVNELQAVQVHIDLIDAATMIVQCNTTVQEWDDDGDDDLDGDDADADADCIGNGTVADLTTGTLVIEIDTALDHDRDDNRNHDSAFDCAEDVQDTNEVSEL